MFEMKSNFDLDENVTFAFQNFMDVDVGLQYNFCSNDGQKYFYNDSVGLSPG